MRYEYRCECCGRKTTETRSVAERDNFPLCVHNVPEVGPFGFKMHRIPSVPQLITEPFHLKEQNRPPEQSSLDRLARMKADEKVYEASYKQSAPEGGASMAELAQKMGVPLG